MKDINFEMNGWQLEKIFYNKHEKHGKKKKA